MHFLKFSLYPNVGNINVEMMQKWILVTARAPLILGEKKKSQKEERPAGQATKNRPLPLSSMSGSANTCKLLIDSASPLVSWSCKTTGDPSPSCEIVILRQFEWEYLRPFFYKRSYVAHPEMDNSLKWVLFNIVNGQKRCTVGIR